MCVCLCVCECVYVVVCVHVRTGACERMSCVRVCMHECVLHAESVCTCSRGEGPFRPQLRGVTGLEVAASIAFRLPRLGSSSSLLPRTGPLLVAEGGVLGGGCNCAAAPKTEAMPWPLEHAGTPAAVCVRVCVRVCVTVYMCLYVCARARACACVCRNETAVTALMTDLQMKA